jgi:hypothetical protein
MITSGFFYINSKLSILVSRTTLFSGDAVSYNKTDALARLLRISYSVNAPVYVQERTYFDIIAKTLEAVNKLQSPSPSLSQIEEALGGKFDVSKYAGFENKGFIIDDNG